MAVEFAEKEEKAAGQFEEPAFLKEAVDQLKEYLSGHRRDFHSLPIVMRATEFQREVWEAASDIPYGFTRTYGQLAEDIGHKGAARAVGTALSRNPICIIVPCHRIVPAGGTQEEPGQYAGGIWRKKWLLTHESPEAAS